MAQAASDDPYASDIVRRYECSGVLEHGDGTPPVACDCIASQRHDGAIRLACVSGPNDPIPANWMKGIFGASMDAAVFKGRLGNGSPIEAEGTLLGHPGGWSRDQGTRATFGLTGNSRLTVGSPDENADWRFAVANLEFSVPPRQRIAPSAGSASLSLTLGEGVVTIDQVPDYDDVIQQLSGRESVRVTAEARVPRSVAFETARDLVGDLCSVLSIAQGTFVNWIFCEQRDGAGQPLFAVHHPAVTRPYNGALPLIDPRPSQELPAFVEKVFARFRELRASYQLAAIARACADVRTTGFLETRCLQLLSLMDYIIGRHATLRREAFIMDDDAFQKGLVRVRPVINGVLRLAFPTLSKQRANRMTEHLRGLNFTTFRRRLRETAADLGVHLDQPDVEALVNTRNQLVHRAAFATDNPFTELRRVQSVLDRLLMGLLGYSGPYIDATTFERSTSH